MLRLRITAWYGMSSTEAIYGSGSDAGGSSDPNYANQLYVQGYHPETDEYRNYYLDDAQAVQIH